MATYINPEDHRLTKDWQECRTTIGRLDTILVDLRKFGFTFVTTLLTADVLFSEKVPRSAPAAAIAVVVIMILVGALFALDMYYQCLLNGAVDRALDIEARTWPPVRTTKYITLNVSFTHSSKVTMALYIVLVLAAAGIAIALCPNLLLLPCVVALCSGIFIVWYWRRVDEKCSVDVFNLKYEWPESASAKSESDGGFDTDRAEQDDRATVRVAGGNAGDGTDVVGAEAIVFRCEMRHRERPERTDRGIAPVAGPGRSG